MTMDQSSAPEPTDLTLSEPDRRELIGWGADCIRRLLPVFVEHRPDDDRLTGALDAADHFRAGELTVGPMRKRAFACHAAARDCTDLAASSVARACGQVAAIAHMGGHARSLPRYTGKALSDAALAEELEYQRGYLPDRFRSYVYGV
ncbi:putative immunity protein [Brevibacterium linens]|uniref:putative immunity protein n=1 Tax=Brevibacterium linens TaxID=1703 RepID=UPI003519D54E